MGRDVAKEWRVALLCVCGGILVMAAVMGCVPAPTPVPTPQMVLGGQRLNFPLLMAAPYQWQRTGYGRPYGAIGKDAELHGKGMWSYTWGMGNCVRDIPMVYSDQQMPSPDVIARCAASSPVLLVFNEPEYASQANMTPEVAARTLRYLESVWPGELWCCGNLVASSGWFDRMLAAYNAEYGGVPRLAGVHLHIYVNAGIPVEAPDDARWLAQSQTAFDRYMAVASKWGIRERVVVTECCLLGEYSESVYVQVMDQYMTWLRSVPEIESVAWFSARYAGFPDANLLQAGGGLTGVGEAWLDWRWK